MAVFLFNCIFLFDFRQLDGLWFLLGGLLWWYLNWLDWRLLLVCLFGFLRLIRVLFDEFCSGLEIGLSECIFTEVCGFALASALNTLVDFVLL
jgi:hypothetical protein